MTKLFILVIYILLLLTCSPTFLNALHAEIEPDFFENDNTMETSTNLIYFITQTHNFHDTNDVDWFVFYLDDEETLKVEIISVQENCSPNIYWQNRNKTTYSNGKGKDISIEVTSDYGDLQYIRIENSDNEEYTINTGYSIRINKSIAAAGRLSGYIYDYNNTLEYPVKLSSINKMKPIEEVEIKTPGFPCKYYNMNHTYFCYGIFQDNKTGILTAKAPWYYTNTLNYDIQKTTELNIPLKPITIMARVIIILQYIAGDKK